jgi:hypothetical protein
MEIIIRTDSPESGAQQSTAQPYVGSTASPQSQSAAPAPSSSDRVTAIDAINAGPAPASPEQSGGPPVHIVANEYRHAESESDVSAGAAPEIP